MCLSGLEILKEVELNNNNRHETALHRSTTDYSRQASVVFVSYGEEERGGDEAAGSVIDLFCP